MLNISQAILALCPTAQFVIYDNDYDQILWHSSEIEKPTKKAVLDKLAVLETELAEQKIVKEAAKAAAEAKLEALGLTKEDLQALGL